MSVASQSATVTYMVPDPTLVELLRQSQKILFFTGAGISTDSGIPDFRGPQGVWKNRQPVYYHDFMNSHAARIEHWDFKLEGWQLFRNARPTPAHKAIARLGAIGHVLLVVTQNIDGLHSAAGTPRDQLVEIHGTNAEIQCQSCGERTEPEPHYRAFAEIREPPACHCGGLLKAATISFGQDLVAEDMQRASESAENTDLVVTLGSTLSVYPAAFLPLIACERGVPYVIVNRGETAHDHHAGVRLRLEGDVQELFPPAANAALEAS
ncbi:MAG: Sir2 family NAD-dependent protein deacetylase [Candidatus Latescibacterota bacterium]|nr:Sir2 family NAD-dependent protein deacetylase [Candidatus Latescibacterota bacterium]